MVGKNVHLDCLHTGWLDALTFQMPRIPRHAPQASAASLASPDHGAAGGSPSSSAALALSRIQLDGPAREAVERASRQFGVEMVHAIEDAFARMIAQQQQGLQPFSALPTFPTK